MLRIYFQTSILYRLIAALILGGFTGLGFWFMKGTFDFTSIVNFIEPFGLILVKMLKMIVIPIVAFSLFTGASSLPLKQFGKVGLRVIIWYIGTSLLAAIIGVLIALLVNPGGDASAFHDIIEAAQTKGVDLASMPITGFSDLIMSLFDNPFHALSEGQFLPIVIFSILFGLAYKFSQDSNEDKSLYKIVEQINKSLFVLVDWILEYAPIGVFALSIANFYQFGPSLIGPYIKIALGVIFAIFIMIFIVYSGMVYFFTKRSPLKFLKDIEQVMITAFVTRSSAATLPVSIKTAVEKLKIRKELADFSLPLGATINMDGVCVHLPMFAILSANLFQIDLGFGQLFFLIISTVLAAVGAGGVPGGSLMLLFIVLNLLGLNESQISLIVTIALGINPILDMFETMNNVTGDLMCGYIVNYQYEDMK